MHDASSQKRAAQANAGKGRWTSGACQARVLLNMVCAWGGLPRTWCCCPWAAPWACRPCRPCQACHHQGTRRMGTLTHEHVYIGSHPRVRGLGRSWTGARFVPGVRAAPHLRTWCAAARLCACYYSCWSCAALGVRCCTSVGAHSRTERAERMPHCWRVQTNSLVRGRPMRTHSCFGVGHFRKGLESLWRLGACMMRCFKG